MSEIEEKIKFALKELEEDIVQVEKELAELRASYADLQESAFHLFNREYFGDKND